MGNFANSLVGKLCHFKLAVTLYIEDFTKLIIRSLKLSPDLLEITHIYSVYKKGICIYQEQTL